MRRTITEPNTHTWPQDRAYRMTVHDPDGEYGYVDTPTNSPEMAILAVRELAWRGQLRVDASDRSSYLVTPRLPRSSDLRWLVVVERLDEP